MYMWISKLTFSNMLHLKCTNIYIILPSFVIYIDMLKTFVNINIKLNVEIIYGHASDNEKSHANKLHFQMHIYFHHTSNFYDI
jgi:hypothetical protein